MKRLSFYWMQTLHDFYGFDWHIFFIYSTISMDRKIDNKNEQPSTNFSFSQITVN